ncbi:MAG: hypothetical protein JST40_07470 [Armatimonadetes bacterium]|nr:hypothetical protein [Armatimonadota bacterium]
MRTQILLAGLGLAVTSIVMVGFGPKAKKPTKSETLDARIGKLLAQTVSILREPPDGDKFGLQRVQTLHYPSFKLSGEDHVQEFDQLWNDLAETHDLELVSFGLLNGKVIRTVHSQDPKTVWQRGSKDQKLTVEARKFVDTEGQKLALKLKDKTSGIVVVGKSIEGKVIFLTVTPVMASENSCIECHEGASMKKPLGIVGIVSMKK